MLPYMGSCWQLYVCYLSSVEQCVTVHSSSNPAEAGHKVVGMEISEKAVKDFFTENHLPHKHAGAVWQITAM